MNPNDLAFAVPIVLAAYIVRGIAGFGSALIAVPLMSLRLPLEFTVPVIIVLDYLGSLLHGGHGREHIAWGEMWAVLPFSAIGVALALFVLKEVDSGFLLQALGVFIIVYSIYQLMPMQHFKGSRYFAPPAGLFAGLAGTLFATGGPFYVTYLMLRGLDKRAFRSTFAALFVIDGSLRILGLGFTGFYNADVLTLLLVLLPVAGIGLFIGGHIHVTMTQDFFKRMISVLLLAAAVPLLLR